MFEGLRGDRRANRDQKAQDEAVATAASLLARRHVPQGARSPETAETTSSAKPGMPGATVAQQLGAVARNAATVYGQGKSDEHKHRDTRNRPDAGQTLTVGSGIQLKGEITNCQTLIVEGHVEGSAKSGALQIADGGAYVGEADIDTAVVSGRFEGTLTAAERLVIRASGRVSGNIRYAAIAIEAGGQISGDIQVIAGKPASEEVPAHADTSSAGQSPQGGQGDRVEIAS